jgi:hypothetical protein
MPLPAFFDYTGNTSLKSFVTNERIYAKLKEHVAGFLPVGKRI